MGIIHNFLNNKYSIKVKAKNAQKKLSIKENDFVFTINDFEQALSFSKLENKFGILNLHDFFTFQKNALSEFEALSKKSTRELLQFLEDKKVILRFDFTHIDNGIFILSFPSSVIFEDKKLFKKELYQKMVLFFLSNNSKQSFEEVSNINHQERSIQQNEKTLNFMECRDSVVSFIIEYVKSNKLKK